MTFLRRSFSVLMVFILLLQTILPSTVNAATSPWTQTSWSSASDYEVAAGINTSTPGQLSLSNTWYSNSWSYRKKITIDHTKVTGTLTDYPVLINLSSDAELHTRARADGNDILFTTADGKNISKFEVEKYTSSTGSLQAWVKISSLSTTTDTIIYLYYGNPSQASSLQDKANTWDDNFIAVYHLNETSGQHLDPASGLNSSTVTVTSQGTAVGKVDGADDFNGTSGNLVQVNDTNALDPTSLTVESWINPDTLPTTLGRDEVFLIKSNNTSPWKSYNLYFSNPYNNIGFDWTNSSDVVSQRFSNSSITTGTWTYVASIKSGSTQNLYLNGADDSGYLSLAPTGTNKNSDGPLLLGNSGSFSFDGKMDEIRISNIARSSTYFSTTYANLNSPSTFVSTGAEEAITSFTGTLTSSIFDTGAASDWGVLTYIATTPASTTASIKVRSGNSPTLSDSSSFSSCIPVTSGADISSNACVSDGHRYIQYQLNLTTTDVLSVPTFTSYSLQFSGSGAPTANGFVQRVGSNLYLDGAPFKFAGANIYWLELDENVGPVDYPTEYRVDDVLTTAREMGANVVRTRLSVGCAKCMETSLGVFNEDAFRMLDYSLKTAKDNGIKFVIPLVDNWHYYHGGKHTFTDWRSVSEDAFYTDATVIADFKNYISHVLNHVNTLTGIAYKDDPTIMAWETGNELYVSSGSWPYAWTDTIATYIKSIDTHHLVADGHSSAPAGYSSLAAASLDLHAVDMYSFHSYPLDISQLVSDASLVGSYNKVYWIGEYDWTGTNGGDALNDFLTSTESTANISGDLFWSLFGHNDTTGFVQHNEVHTIHYPGDTVDMRDRVSQLRTHAYQMRGLSTPSPIIPSAPLLYAVTANSTNNTITWRGSAGAQYYHVERYSGWSGWEVLATTTTDNTLPFVDTTALHGVNYGYRVTPVNIASLLGHPSNVVYSLGYSMALPQTLSASTPELKKPEPQSCGDSKPVGNVDLFQIDRKGKTATLYFTPVSSNVHRYNVIFGYKDGDEKFGGVGLESNSLTKGVQSVTVGYLDPKRAYSFHVLPTNGCAVGTWSNWMSAKPSSNSLLKKFYKYL